MNSMECEDPMGGLMPQILALTAPPGTKEINSKQLQQPTQSVSGQLPPNGNGSTKAGEAGLAAHPYFRRPGRGHNHDCCDACSEGGDLICCDLCPASFHLTCHDPPLEEDEIPTGEWACHQCRMGGNEDEKVSNSSNKSSKSSKLPKKKEEAKIKEECNKVYAGGREIEISDTPLYTLIRAAAVINPIQFTLPYELTIPANFPGEPKDAFIKKNGSKRSSLKKKPYELDNGIVPLPAKLCFQCNKSCRVGPLVPCDFCPLFYHLDCLDPPLTTPPMGRWMCPNHPEHHLDASLTSHSLTERVKLWDKFTVPLDQDAVKLNFFQRCHRSNPPFRYKVKKALRSRLRVPGAIKAHYEHPPDLLPHRHHRYSVSNSFDECVPSSFSNSMWPAANNISYTSSSKSFESNEMEETNINDANVMQDGPSIPELQEIEKMEEEEFNNNKPTKEEKYHWLSSLLHLQSSISRHLASNYLPVKNNIVNDLKMEISSDACNGLDDSKETFSATKPKFLNGDLISLENKSHKCSGRLSGQISHSNLLASQTSCSSSKRNHKTQKSNFISRRQSKSVVPSEIVSDTLDSLEVLLKERIKHEEEKQEIPLSSLEQNLVELLAYERLKEILDGNKSDIVFSSSSLAARALLCPLVPDVKLKSILPKSKAYSTEPVPMMYRILNIGKGTHNHLNLENFGHCNYISHHHASIIFDETTGHYELLNYSEYDTVVDGVTYNCEYENKTVDQAVSPPYLQQVKAIIAMRRGGGQGDSLRSSSTPAAMCSRPGEKFVRCNCRLDANSSFREDRERGWEGAAVLHHGSFVRFGCLKFVLSVVEEASKGDWFKDTTTTYEKFLKRAEDEREFEKQEDSEHQEEDLSDNKS